MKNISYYTDNSFEFHKKVLESKYNTSDDPTYKMRVESMDEAIENQFLIYDENFSHNTLENIENYRHTEEEKSDLIKLYSYKNSVIKKLKNKITTSEANRIINTCPYCTLNEINTFDHYLPKEEFPEFVVNPKNLFPCCSVCNGYKNRIWVNDEKRLFLNLYLDLLPIEQYLFVNLIITDDLVTATFYIRNNGNITGKVFKIIETHYNRLHLLNRFSENINETITSLEITINSFKTKLPLGDIKNSIIERCNQGKIAFGHNYWKSILELELVNNDEYMNRFTI